MYARIGGQIKIGRAIEMIIMEWIKKITDIIMPPPPEDDEEAKETKKADKKVEEPLREVAAEQKAEEPKEQPAAQPVQSFQAEKQAATGAMGNIGKFTRTNSNHVSTAEGVTSMNGMRYEAYTAEASVRPSFVKTPQMTMKIYTPTKYDELVKAVGQDLIKRSAVLVNYETVDEPTQQRISDFVLGVVYTINGHVELITKKIVLYVPEGFEVESAQAMLANSIRRYN